MGKVGIITSVPVRDHATDVWLWHNQYNIAWKEDIIPTFHTISIVLFVIWKTARKNFLHNNGSNGWRAAARKTLIH